MMVEKLVRFKIKVKEQVFEALTKEQAESLTSFMIIHEMFFDIERVEIPIGEIKK